MPYIHLTRTPGATIENYQAVLAALGTTPIAGRQSHWAGTQDGALCTVDVWDSRSDADRFAAERLFPAFEQAGFRPSAETQFVAFDAAEVSNV
jgi:hypothetical protein